MPIHEGFLSRLADILIYTILGLASAFAILPFIYVLVNSFSANETVFPTEFTLDAYRYILSTDKFIRSMGVSIYITVLGSVLSLVVTSFMAYALSNRKVPGRQPVLMLVLFTILFSGGMIPTYFVVRAVGMIDTYWALMIPGLLSGFYLIVMKDFFQNVPDELKEAAEIDGCHEVGIFFRVVLPLSLPAMAAFGLFYAVGLWNQYFSAIIYINDSNKWPVQVLLQQVVVQASGSIGDSASMGENVSFYGQSVRMAVIIVSTVPILCVYPFLQKHFAKGVLLGSVKG
ncbi:carbohydrate ABC transporter permease [Paenibacillus daejeonensis]|uniref:carbohydrate ABC transporter permease n=1 Tax=Paenibacillus daejeonensis TaxID=135193 RepID=UPI00036A66E4|nr:carbohydrate ABC transporter permease [Paenibacillus daejeonensis]